MKMDEDEEFLLESLFLHQDLNLTNTSIVDFVHVVNLIDIVICMKSKPPTPFHAWIVMQNKIHWLLSLCIDQVIDNHFSIRIY